MSWETLNKNSFPQKTYPDDMKLARESFKLLRALAGNDKVKSSIIQHDAAPIINDVLNKHKVISPKDTENYRPTNYNYNFL